MAENARVSPLKNLLLLAACTLGLVGCATTPPAPRPATTKANTPANKHLCPPLPHPTHTLRFCFGAARGPPRA